MLSRPMTFIIHADESLPGSIARMARDFHDRTREYWLDWVRQLSIPFEWQEAVIRAAITLKLCSFEDTGAIVAALTTSIPEAPASGRNWDYRYCWLRDAYFTCMRSIAWRHAHHRAVHRLCHQCRGHGAGPAAAARLRHPPDSRSKSR